MSNVPAPHVYVHERGVWSSSLLQQYLRCPRAWWVIQHSSGPNTTLAPVHWRRGTVAHAAMQAAFEARIVYGQRVMPRDPAHSRMDFFYAAADAALHTSWAAERMPSDPAMLEQLREDVRLVLAKLSIPRVANILGVEKELRGKLGGVVPVRSYLDLVLKLAPDWVHVRDWKTFSALPTREELRAGIQLPLYGYMARMAYPWARRISVSIYSIPANAEVTVELTDADLAGLESRVMRIVAEADADEDCPPVPSEWCGTCPAKPYCPIWNPDTAVGPHVDRNVLAELRDTMAALDGF
jgi:hypothetical protein